MVKRNVVFVVALTLIVLLPFIFLKRKNNSSFLSLKPHYQIIGNVLASKSQIYFY